MTLEEQLKMATATVEAPSNAETTVSIDTQITQVPAEPNLANIAEEVKMTTNAPVTPVMMEAQQPLQNPQIMSANMGQTPVMQSAPMPQNMGQPTHMYNNPVNTNTYQNNINPTQFQNNVQPQVATVAPQGNIDEEVTYASKTVEFGQPASTRAIENLKKLDAGEQIRFTILDIPREVRFVHKVETAYGSTKVVCWSNPDKGIKGACCHDSEPKARYFYPIMVYPTMPGNPNMIIPEGKPELRLMILWDYGVVQSLTACVNSMGGDFTKMDLLGTSMDNFGKLQFFPAQGCNRDQYAQHVQTLTQYWNQNKGNINGNFGKLLNDQKYYNLTRGAQQQVPQMQSYNQTDMFGAPQGGQY